MVPGQSICNGTGPVRVWTPPEEDFIRKNAGLGVEELAVRLGRTPRAVRNRAAALGTRLGRHSVLPSVKGRDAGEAVRSLILNAIEHDTVGGCWLWAHLNLGGGGYGRVGIRGFRGSAHRASWRVFRGEIPAGLNVLHKCDTPACVNPDHLFLGTHKENTRDMIAKGRGAKRQGEANTQAKLTADDVREIRRRVTAGALYREVAADFAVTVPTICDINRGRSWGHVR